MAAILVDSGLTEALKLLTDQSSTDMLYLHLYASPRTPAVTDVIGDYVPLEPDPADGYSPFDLDPTSWFLNVTAGVVTLLYPPINFAFTGGPYTIYGFFVTKGVSDVLICAGEFDVPVDLDAMGAPGVDVSVQLGSKNCP